MHIPCATYRLQFCAEFGFVAAQDIISYLNELGISDIYASPIFKAVQGSTHGYDITDPTSLNPELGTKQDFFKLRQLLAEHEMSWLQDIVPNHMAYSSQNSFLMDVLEKGQYSRYINYFDLQWDNHLARAKKKILAPFLGNWYYQILKNGEIKINYSSSGFNLSYYEIQFPLCIESYLEILQITMQRLKSILDEDDSIVLHLTNLLSLINNLAFIKDLSLREAQAQLIKKTLWRLYSEDSTFHVCLESSLAWINNSETNQQARSLLDKIISAQNYLLSYWKVASLEINYRRFFSINDLICVKMENKQVFQELHKLIFELVKQNTFNGLRIDHLDGLLDPAYYLSFMREELPDTYLIAEKILQPEEELPRNWPLQGTTGYDFMYYVNSLFCNQDSEAEFKGIYSQFNFCSKDKENPVAENKRMILFRHMSGELENLVNTLYSAIKKHSYARDIPYHSLKKALEEILVHFPVYRTYINNQDCSQDDLSYLQQAFKQAKSSAPLLDFELECLKTFIFQKNKDLNPEGKQERDHFLLKLQQLTGPLMAKGFEDTYLYTNNLLISLNDVGGDPRDFGISLDKFHNYNQKKIQHWPYSLNASATHDTKRGEDIRARLNVLSEMPQEWEKHLRLWQRKNAVYKHRIGDKDIPDGNEEYFLYQTLLGAFPFEESEFSDFCQRIKDYLIKALREAKINTSWLEPDLEYEKCCLTFLNSILIQSGNEDFLSIFLPFQKKVAFYGIFNSLSQTLLKITSPGIPDMYQGCELWDLNLVDPDNRRAVSYQKRKEFLEDIQNKWEKDPTKLCQELLAVKENGMIKLFTLQKALQTRKENKKLFLEDKYLPLQIKGPHKEKVVAFARSQNQNWILVIAPRFYSHLVQKGQSPIGRDIWLDTEIILPETSPKNWKSIFCTSVHQIQERLFVGDVLNNFPVGLLMSSNP